MNHVSSHDAARQIEEAVAFSFSHDALLDLTEYDDEPGSVVDRVVAALRQSI